MGNGKRHCNNERINLHVLSCCPTRVTSWASRLTHPNPEGTSQDPRPSRSDGVPRKAECQCCLCSGVSYPGDVRPALGRWRSCGMDLRTCGLTGQDGRRKGSGKGARCMHYAAPSPRPSPPRGGEGEEGDSDLRFDSIRDARIGAPCRSASEARGCI